MAIFKSFFIDFEPFGFSQPDSWKEVTVDDIATEVICGKTPPTADAGNYGGSVPFITIPDMHGSVYTTSTERFLSDKGVATQANKTLPENSICVSCIASVGLVCLTAEPSQTNQQINSIICKKNISPFYVYIKMTTLTEYLINGSMSRACSVGRKTENTSGIPTASRPPSGSSTSRKRTATTQQ